MIYQKRDPEVGVRTLRIGGYYLEVYDGFVGGGRGG